MKKENLSKTAQEKENMRILAVNMVVEGKLKKKVVSDMLWVHYNTIIKRVSLHKKWWKRSLKTKQTKWGRPKSKDNNLTTREKKIMIRILQWEPRDVQELHLDFGLWTIKIIQTVVHKVIGKKLKEWKIKEFLDEIWYTNQKPIFRAYQQDPEKVEKRIKEELPNILTEAESEWRSVFYWDEAGFKSTDNRWKTRAEKWKTPVVKSTWARFGINAISIVWSKWEMRFMVYEWWFTSDTLLVFIKKILCWNDKKYTLILDGHPTHKSKKVKAYLESTDGRIKIYYLPWYSPQLNPDELLRNCVKCDMKWTIYRSKQELCKKLLSTMYSHQKQKDKIKSFF